ncbi:MAG: flippase-like domain-containing protein [Moorea sp. SIOASIH]|uniref:lysylphosphatidylglycerol synthase transmembrane domain-containing protein n=1 Tax=Moorena sp. SIOASIH TaxID=2607817 RepID=UPI0013BC3E0C|nr:lysylphosphatidylglycerol synthase transmembrane domain-containing protein [Moorena sp. SIOASIH]NEO42228.1 flippase-like domain-containing protein [Moorena sp. SIOASIH]NEO91437.1 flippase-like domain-containing protein [Moorena sp. SIO3G5]
MGKSSILRFLRIAVTTALLVYVFHKAGLLTLQGWRNLFDTFAHTKLIFLLASILILPILDFASSVKWYFLCRSCGLSVGLWRLYAYYVIGKFFSLILPSSIGGDVIRIHELGRYTGRYADAAAVVFVERFSGLATLVMLALIAVIVNLQVFNIPWLTISLSIGILGLGFICWLIVDDRPFNLSQKLFGERLPILKKIFSKIEKFRNAVLLYKDDSGALVWALVNSLIFYFLSVINVWVSALTFNADINFISTLVAVPVIMFIMNLPFSIGGIGLTEFAYTFTLGIFGVNPAVAISTTLLMRLKTFIDAGIGGLLYPLVKGENSTARELSKEIEKSYNKQYKD